MAELIDSIRDSITNSDISLVSFDIFDTLVYRKVPKPQDIFLKVFEQSGDELGAIESPYEYREMRQFAEKKAKGNKESGEVSLNEIFDYLPFDISTKQRLIKKELELELKYGFIFPELVRFIDELQCKNIQVVLVSDMYLSADQIKQTFLYNSPTLLNLPLFVSSEHDQNKRSGIIFKMLSQKLNVAYDQWIHVGDNLHSDFKSPKVLGINGIHFAPRLDFNRICEMEHEVYRSELDFNAARSLSAIGRDHTNEAISYEIGSIVWGPILLGFADWVIDRALAVKSPHILCLMREGEVYVPIIKQRLLQRKIANIEVAKLFASRKSTFWPSIDIEDENWFEKLFYTLCLRRGYSVGDFYRDFYIAPDSIIDEHGNELLRSADSVYIDQQNLLKLLTDRARKNLVKVKAYILQQKALFLSYFENQIRVDFGDCCIVDFGNGGTIQNQLESIFGHSSSANLLFYSSNRIHNSIQQTQYSSFINASNDVCSIRKILSRSPECIEVFLVGDCGSTLGYAQDGSPILDETLQQNSHFVNSFMAGAQSYIDLHHQLGFGDISSANAIAILNRYIQLPTQYEAELFTRICHQDNFGSNQVYPVISNEQINKVKSFDIQSFYLQFQQYTHWLIGDVHWPQAVISLVDKDFLFKQTGFLSMDTNRNALSLVNLIIDKGWTHFSVYGAGAFFESLLPHLAHNGLHVDFLVDRKADINGEYEVQGHPVSTLGHALKNNSRCFVVSSFAYKQEIAKNISHQAHCLGIKRVEILSL